MLLLLLTSKGKKDHNSSPAREKNWLENEFDKLIEVGLRKWIIRNFSELKEHVLTECYPHQATIDFLHRIPKKLL